MALPQNTCGRLLPCSGNTINKQVDVKAGVIDADITGEMKVLLHKFGEKTQNFCTGDKIAQLVVESIHMSTPRKWTESIPQTERG